MNAMITTGPLVLTADYCVILYADASETMQRASTKENLCYSILWSHQTPGHERNIWKEIAFEFAKMVFLDDCFRVLMIKYNVKK
jgi:hypothetical protein